MVISLVYRLFKNPKTGKPESIKPIEYSLSENDAKRYARLFDLQIPLDLKDKVQHLSVSTTVYGSSPSFVGVAQYGDPIDIGVVVPPAADVQAPGMDNL